MNCYIGTSGWTYRHWKGTFYPAGLPATKWFEYYLGHFNSVEINATFYRYFKDETFIKWRERVPDYFRFVLKVPRIVSHRKMLIGSEKEIGNFCRQALLLERKLGCVLLQLPPQLAYNLQLLSDTLHQFDKRVPVAVEFRNRCWNNEDIRKLLIRTSTIFCDADSPITARSGWITSGKAYIRLHGRTGWYTYDYSEEELKGIAHSIDSFRQAGAKEVFVFFNNDFHGHAPKNALMLMKILGQEGDISVPHQ